MTCISCGKTIEKVIFDVPVCFQCKYVNIHGIKRINAFIEKLQQKDSVLVKKFSLCDHILNQKILNGEKLTAEENNIFELIRNYMDSKKEFDFILQTGVFRNDLLDDKERLAFYNYVLDTDKIMRFYLNQKGGEE